jgi:hypothetical protein
VNGGPAVAKRHANTSVAPSRAHRDESQAKKMSKGAFQGDWGSPLEV